MAYIFKGIPIFKLSTFEELCSNMRLLLEHGYREANKKPALFFRRGVGNEVYFADMRGTEIVPIYEDTSPLFYALFPQAIPYWKRCRVASAEYKNLAICRISNDFDSDEYAISIPELGIYMSNGNAGYCEQCGIDFGGDGAFCSVKCAELFEDLHSPHCTVCKKRLEYFGGIEHHLNYAQDITILVCRSCHLKIHRGTAFEDYKPIDRPILKMVG